MYDGLAEATEAVELYKPPEGKAQITARIPGSVREGLDDVIRLWRAVAEARGDKHVEKIDLSYVIGRLLQVGVERAFGEVGGRPMDEAAWKLLERTIEQTARETTKLDKKR